MPEIASQPAIAEGARASQLQPAQLHLQALYSIPGNLAILREQAQRTCALPLLVENVESFTPCRFLLVVDLTQIQNGALRGLTGRQTPILHNAEVAVLLA